MKIEVINKKPSVVNQFLAQLRDVNVQKDRLRFRRNLERVGEIMAYEISKALDYRTVSRNSPLSDFDSDELVTSPYLITILRASLPFFQGFLNIFDEADSGFIGAYRKSTGGDEFDISLDYLAAANLTDKQVIITDPMLATGRSLVDAVRLLLDKGTPKHIHLACVISSEDGVSYVQEQLADKNLTLWTAAMDAELNDHYYIVPGLGDAGDLAFGEKL